MPRARRPFDKRAALLTGAALAIGLLGAGDPVGLLAWLALIAPALGFALGRLAFWPFGPAILGGWGMALTFTDLGAEQHLPTPLWGLFAIGGLLGCGWALGGWCARRSEDTWLLGGAGLVLLLTLGLAGGPVAGELGRADASLARERPGVARALLALSPLTLTLECAGLDWTHSHPEIYRRSGVEWFPRHPYRGAVAGSILLAVGAGAALLFARRSRFPADQAPIRRVGS